MAGAAVYVWHVDHQGRYSMYTQGATDENIPVGMTERFVATYQAAGGAADLHVIPDMPHGFITRDVERPESVAAVALIADFVRSQAE